MSTRARIAMMLLAATVAATTTAQAQPAAPPTTIAVAPMTMLGAEDTSAQARQYEQQIAKAITASGAATKVVTAAEVVEATRKAKKSALRACDGDAACLSELGALLGVQVVVFGEVGGLGDVQEIGRAHV